ncbi:pimeloyl-ACP methyl ester carboxylesterase [Rubricella aquisinus]|uniref:Pimeloyl-ACP methyl ester carboxylesterase n=1 Tax=Rubricella aquisinus TaxID=2028108 RepID=A0A840WQ83_9RHOB|nr:alpha/beta fold hydrolase [Rubricella aquisinus]MBB5517198.1 pimeloyl-ACP methyl ester carboxylesterase [Rubricella aquisinus]
MPVKLNILSTPSEGTGTPLLIVHGLFGSGRNWGAIAKRLSAQRPILSVDMRNHGDSPRTDSHTYQDMADDLAQVIEDAGGPMHVLGHSMGGKAAMILALTRPELVDKLIVADIAPVAYGHTQMPLIDAMRALDLGGVTRRSDADKALAAAIPDPGTRAFLIQSLAIGEGDVRWKLNLDTLATEMDKILSFPLISGVHQGEALFVTGGTSDYVQAAHRPAIRALFPEARFETIAGAGHWLHAEQPRPFVEVVDRFLAG